MKASELRQMTDDQLAVTLKDTAEGLFRLRMQSQSERLNTSSRLKNDRRLIARIRTIQTERESSKKAAV